MLQSKDRRAVLQSARWSAQRLSATGPLSAAIVDLIASAARVTPRTVWRWAAQVSSPPKHRAKFVLGEELRIQLALWNGNVRALHRELVETATPEGPAVPSLRTFYRAVHEALTPGDLAAFRKGMKAARSHDVYLRRPEAYRNQAWEGDHKQAPVEVDVEGELLKPWVTWFIDTGTNYVMGVAVTPDSPNRQSILVALRASIMTQGSYGPAGGLPELVRIDRGKDFLSKVVGSFFAAFAVQVVDLRGYEPFGKGSIETLNGAADSMLFCRLPRYSGSPKLINGKPVDPDAPPLTFEAFVEELLTWVAWWNRHEMDALNGMTPIQAWQSDATPVVAVPDDKLYACTLEDDGRERTITTKGVQWRNRYYVAAWMTGLADSGMAVRLGWMLHHDHEVVVFEAGTEKYLGPAYLADEASPEVVTDVLRRRKAAHRRAKADLQRAARASRVRYAAQTVAGAPRRLTTMTTAEASAELAEAAGSAGRRADRRKPILNRPVPKGWTLPLSQQRATQQAAERQDGEE